uniref:Uncharacterized protein n=1 Tax=Attheya septentrionalis TaxID=420275 RepID=A0A7S2U938_9STRA|mmetsp:Transcript_12868/g.23303  ORF Transcript_12868/g.23303 Transcript_12868/m.23303 type:complete len:173 (+) Transcript_12868:227-745(+)
MATQGETCPSSGHELNNDAFRIKAAQILSQLESDADEHHAGPQRSWVKGEILRPIPTQDAPQYTQSDNSSKRSKSFDQNGFILVKNFVGEREVADMKEQMETLADTQWDPLKKTVAFRTDEKQIDTQGSDDYFLESASRVHYFAENDALNEDGSLKEEYKSNKTGALNKAVT